MRWWKGQELMKTIVAWGLGWELTSENTRRYRHWRQYCGHFSREQQRQAPVSEGLRLTPVWWLLCLYLPSAQPTELHSIPHQFPALHLPHMVSSQMYENSPCRLSPLWGENAAAQQKAFHNHKLTSCEILVSADFLLCAVSPTGNVSAQIVCSHWLPVH